MKKVFNLRKSQKGVSLVELLLYMAILAFLLTILTSVFTQALDVQLESQATSSVEQDGNYIISRLAYDIHRAQAINVPATKGEPSDSFQIVIDGTNYTYSVDVNKNLILSGNSEINSLNNFGTDISAFSVSRFGNSGKIEDTLKINFTVTSKTKRASGFEIKNFQTNLSLRRQ